MCIYCEMITTIKIMNISITLKIDLLSVTICNILEFYIKGIIQYVLFGGVQFLSLNLIILIFIHVIVCISSSLLFITE